MKRITTEFTVIDCDEEFYSIGSCLQHEINVDYNLLVKTFGPPTFDGDGEKVDAEWKIGTPDGVATIYNYKSGKNYLGASGLPTALIRDWHIGGFDKRVVPWVTKVIDIAEQRVIRERDKVIGDEYLLSGEDE